MDRHFLFNLYGNPDFQIITLAVYFQIRSITLHSVSPNGFYS
ncbi:hypothetical protein [Robinsoniella peoriensis]|nr:hypothetical protein [Robinsoniella peoriensis]MDU7029926.1 hypothetical protein [Clostridiales bacterium]